MKIVLSNAVMYFAVLRLSLAHISLYASIRADAIKAKLSAVCSPTHTPPVSVAPGKFFWSSLYHGKFNALPRICSIA